MRSAKIAMRDTTVSPPGSRRSRCRSNPTSCRFNSRGSNAVSCGSGSSISSCRSRGNRFSATRAAELGLINRAVPAEELDAAVEEVLADLRLGGPSALGFAKSLIYAVPAMEQKEAFEWTAALSARLFKSEGAAAGMKAFLKRLKPPWAAEKV